MVNITATTQLSTFDLIKNAILANTTLSHKFSGTNIYQYEPKHKSNSFKGFPYILVEVPTSNPSDETYLGDNFQRRDFESEITIRMDYTARDNLVSYASALVQQLNSSKSTFNASGYELINVTSEAPLTTAYQEKEVVEITIILTLNGEVAI